VQSVRGSVVEVELTLKVRWVLQMVGAEGLRELWVRMRWAVVVRDQMACARWARVVSCLEAEALVSRKCRSWMMTHSVDCPSGRPLWG
jgi:hypothetical protein